ncbi:MAG: hypothetical protein AAFQ57_15665, partial [Cyanobacteria bacterium J06626_14]
MTAEDNTNEESLDERSDPRSLSIQGSVDESTVVVGDRNVINQGPSYYITNVFEAFKSEQFPARPSQQLSKDEYRWRQVLVQNVKRYWIEGVLEKSLHNQALIELGLEERSQAVVSPIGAAAVSIFILPPSIAALETRLNARNQDAPDTIARRMSEARS